MRRGYLLVLLAVACAPKTRSVAAATEAPPPPAISSFQLLAATKLAEALDFEFVPLAPIGPGFYAAVRSKAPTGGEGVAYLGPDPNRSLWTFGSDPPADVLRAASLERVTGSVRFDTTKGRITGDVRLQITTGGARLIPVMLDALPDSLRVETGAGRTCAVARVPSRDIVVVELPAPAEKVELRIRWETRTPQVDHVHIRKDSLLLPGLYPWVPTLPNTDADFDLTFAYRKGFDLLPGGKSGRVSTTFDGWRSVTTKFHSDQPVTLAGRKMLVRHPFDLDGVPVTLALEPRDVAKLPGLEASVRDAFAALRPLGPLPHRLHIAWCPQSEYQGIASRGFIGLDDFDHHVVAHELAHQYFQDIDDQPPPLKAWELLPETRDWSGDWTEAVAEFLATWAKDENEARAHRLGWSFRYAHVSDLQPLREIRDKGLPSGDPRHVVVYTKGPLLLAEMERRLGRERMAAALTGFIDEYRGKRADWSDLADAFGGDDAVWLRQWLTIPGSPRIQVKDLSVSGGFVEGTIAVSPASFAGVVQLGVITTQDAATLRMDQAPSQVHDVPFSGEETRFRVPVGEGATGLLIDPNHRLPRRWDGFEGLFVALPDPVEDP